MPDPIAATETQLRNIEAATGMSMAAFAAAAADRGIEGHAKTLAFLKEAYGLSHGNANAVALRVRELAAGGPASTDALLDAQYAGGKAVLRPVYERLAELASGLGPDVEILVQKTGVAFRRRKQFGLVQAASAKRVALGLNLDAAPDDPRVIPTPGAMCGYRVDLDAVDAVDGDVAGWLRQAYERAGSPGADRAG
jgi:predicted transport protein